MQIKYVDTKGSGIPGRMLHNLVLDDPSVEYFLIRDVHARIGPRDLTTVQEWLKSDAGLHGVFDHPSADTNFLDPSHWGGKMKVVRPLMHNHTMLEILRDACEDTSCTEQVILEKVFKLDINHDVLFIHNTVSCSTEEFMHDITMERLHWEFIGQKFDKDELAQSKFPKDFRRNC